VKRISLGALFFYSTGAFALLFNRGLINNVFKSTLLICANLRLPHLPREIHDSESEAYFTRVAPADRTGVAPEDGTGVKCDFVFI